MRIHAGEVIIGTMGYREHAQMTAIGEVVHVASRPQDLIKEYDCQLVVSEIVGVTAGITLVDFPGHDIQVRGLSAPLTIRAIDSAAELVTNPQTGKPLDPKSLRKHFALEIRTGAVEANVRIASLIYATILGLPPPPGTVAITVERMRVRLAIFWARTRMGWRRVDEHRGKPGYRKFYRPYP
jgi:hypothetical protein